MKTRYFALLMAILLVGCSAPAATELITPTETATIVPSEATPTIVAPTATNTLVPPTTTPGFSSSEVSEVWDLVYISDSTGMGVAVEYADRIERDLGVQIEVHDLCGGGLSARKILDALRGKDRWMSCLSNTIIEPVPFIEEAEVIVVYGNWFDSETAEHPWDWNCAIGFEPHQFCQETTSCGPETFAQYEANLAAIFDEIFAIRGGKPVILRTADWYLPWGPLETWRECGHEEICKQCLLNWADAIHRVADEYGVPVAGLLKAFSGPDLDLEMPREFIRDDVHPSDQGAAAIADVLADLGYEPVAPKK
jgi:hypothetical protein